MSLSIGGALLAAGLKIIDKVIPDPQAKIAAQQRFLELQQNAEFKELDARMAAIVSEAQSSDPWTSRARPTFMYVFYVVILGLVLLAPAIGVFAPEGMARFFENVAKGFQAIPDALWATFTAGYLGYAGLRTYEKKTRTDK